jgi:hypothetical protein
MNERRLFGNVKMKFRFIVQLKMVINLNNFTNLCQASRRVDDLFEDLRDGHNLLSLLEVLSGEHLVRFFL